MTTPSQTLGSEQHAIAVAHNWAIARGKDPTKFSAFAADFWSRFPHLSEDALEIQLRYFDDACADSREMWKFFAAKQWELQAEWTIE
jgi:hypothetical protein